MSAPLDRRLRAIRRLHEPVQGRGNLARANCKECGFPHPCKTVELAAGMGIA